MDWHILQIAPRQENRSNRWLSGEETIASAHLIGRRIKTYLPMRSVVVRRGPSRKRVTCSVPLIPGYLFAQLPDDLSWGHARSAPGVRGFLTLNDQPATITQAALERIQSVERGFRPGDRVSINDDTNLWDGYEGVLLSLDKKDRAVVEIMLPSLAWRIVTDATRLEAVL
jgi:transcription antitermination factor NusG